MTESLLIAIISGAIIGTLLSVIGFQNKLIKSLRETLADLKKLIDELISGQ